MGPSPRRSDIVNNEKRFCHAHPGKPDRNAEVMTVQRIWGQEWCFHGAGTKTVIWTGDKCYKPFKKSLNEHKSLKTALENQASSISWVLCPRGGNVWGYSGIARSPGHFQGNVPLVPPSMQLKEGVRGFTHQYHGGSVAHERVQFSFESAHPFCLHSQPTVAVSSSTYYSTKVLLSPNNLSMRPPVLLLQNWQMKLLHWPYPPLW